MITLPWTLAASPAGTVTVIAARLPLRSVQSLPATSAWTWRLRRALRDTPGSAGYAFAFQVSGCALWTVSAWASRTELTAFEHSAVHRAAKSELRPRLRPATFAVWNCDAAQLPIEWFEVRRRIAAAGPATRRPDSTSPPR